MKRHLPLIIFVVAFVAFYFAGQHYDLHLLEKAAPLIVLICAVMMVFKLQNENKKLKAELEQSRK